MITDSQHLNQKLATAVLHGDANTVRTLLDEGADPCYMDKTCTCFTDKNGSVPVLMLAVQRDDVVTARLLLEAGADVHAKCFPYIHSFCAEVDQRLNATGNPYRAFGISSFGREMIGARPLEFARSAEMASLLMEHGAELVCAHNHYCGKEGYEALTEVLLHDERNPLNPQLIDAIRRGDAAAVRKLLAEGANVNARVATGPHGCEVIRPLDAAINERRLELVALLLENGADVHKVSYPLHFGWNRMFDIDRTAEKYHQCIAAIAKLLIECGAAPNDTSFGIDLVTPLHQAADCGNIALIVQLLKGGAAINCSDYHGRTPLHIAAENGHIAIVELLLDHGAPIDVKDRCQRTALQLASLAGHQETARLLLARGSKQPT